MGGSIGFQHCGGRGRQRGAEGGQRGDKGVGGSKARWSF